MMFLLKISDFHCHGLIFTVPVHQIFKHRCRQETATRSNSVVGRISKYQEKVYLVPIGSLFCHASKISIVEKTLVIRDPMKYKLVQNGGSHKGQLCNLTTKRVVEPVPSATRLFPWPVLTTRNNPLNVSRIFSCVCVCAKNFIIFKRTLMY